MDTLIRHSVFAVGLGRRWRSIITAWRRGNALRVALLLLRGERERVRTKIANGEYIARLIIHKWRSV